MQMRNLSYILVFVLGLGLVLFGCDGLDDDSADDDSADDDDDSTPSYTGTIDMAGATLTATCAATVESVPDGPTPEGWFEMEIDLSGWGDDMWIEFWDGPSDYCEGYYPKTGDPCEAYGYTRPGWGMNNIDFGWNSTDGFWDYWDVNIDYIMDLAVADGSGKSIFICENAGLNFETWFCGCDNYDPTECDCTLFDSW